MSQEQEERSPPTIEQFLANLKGDEKADPNLVAVAEILHERIKALEGASADHHRRTMGLQTVGGALVSG